MKKSASRHPSLACLVCGVLLALITASASAVPVQGLYEAAIAVDNQSEAERNRAYREALERVLIKVSGQPAVVERPAVRDALQRAADYVASVTYRSDTVTPIAEPDEPEPASRRQDFLDLGMQPDEVDQLLLDAGAGVWDRHRPAVLLWLVVQDSSGERRLLSSGSGHPALAVMEQFSGQRAVPFRIPLLDLVDRRALSTEQAWGLDEEAIAQASQRYGASAVLAGRILETVDGEYVGVWQFQFRDGVESFDHLASDVTSFMERPLEQATVRMAEYFALSREDLAREEEMVVRVDDITSLDAYASVLGYLRELAVVNQVHPALLNEERLELSLRVAGGADRLGEFIRLDRDLAVAGDADPGALQYRWTR